MKPLIYLYQEQLQEFLNTKTEAVGAAYEWKGESVYHAYFDYPKVSPTGFPSLCLFSLRNKSIEDVINDFLSLNQGSKKPNYIIGIQFTVDGSVILKRGVIFDGNEFKEAEVKYVPTKSELYTRSKGLLEVDALEKKYVLIVGLGSGGSNIAVELAKAGVGNFSLVDFDRIELHNIARHICGVNELGRLKTNAVKDAILLKNPYARINTFDFDINDHLDIIEQEVLKADLTIVATDELKSRFSLNDLILKHKKTGLFGRAVTRAEGGDVLRVRPGGPCYACLKGGGWYNHMDEISDIRRAREFQKRWQYMSEQDVQALVQAGLSTDIAPINTMMVKLALLELSRGTDCEISSLDAELTYDYYMWANRRDNHYRDWAPFNSPEKKLPTILRWIGVKLSKDSECMVCNNG
jgi:molybdopterin/thiamine biosynthesis adenylyltransferase